jgi:hypothetical protein
VGDWARPDIYVPGAYRCQTRGCPAAPKRGFYGRRP